MSRSSRRTRHRSDLRDDPSMGHRVRAGNRSGSAITPALATLAMAALRPHTTYRHAAGALTRAERLDVYNSLRLIGDFSPLIGLPHLVRVSPVSIRAPCRR